MTGGSESQVKVVLRNPLNKSDQIDYTISLFDTALSYDWLDALKGLLRSKNLLEKSFCFMGFPDTARDLTYLCNELNDAVRTINLFNSNGTWSSNGLEPYVIEEYFTPDSVMFGDEYPAGYNHTSLGRSTKHQILNRLHNHFERLQGTVWDLSPYYLTADYATKYAIRQLNNLCHEIESHCLSLRKVVTAPEWVRPSQITTFLHAPRLDLTDEHRTGFAKNGYDRRFGNVYMHWTQIGKTLFEVFRDEKAPSLVIDKNGDSITDISVIKGATCEAITSLKYYSGEFDIEWGNDVVLDGPLPWHKKEQAAFRAWLMHHDLNPQDPKLSLGYLPIAKVELMKSFDTSDPAAIWKILGQHLDIYKIEAGDVSNTFDYCWSDVDYKDQQIEMMKPGYDFSSKNFHAHK